MKLTQLFGKQVFSLYEGEIVGTISGAIFNDSFSKIKAFKIFDQDENELELLLCNIKAMADYIIINNKSKLQYYFEAKNKSLMHKTIIDDVAKNRGKIIDADIENSGVVNYYITDQNEQLLSNNLYLRKEFIYYTEKTISVSKYKPKHKIVSPTNIKVNILYNNENSSREKFIPSRIQYDPSKSLGKVVKNDLYGINNEIIIKANQQITEKVINDASRHNRLNQLFYIAV